jgi:hypothetical protein
VVIRNPGLSLAAGLAILLMATHSVDAQLAEPSVDAASVRQEQQVLFSEDFDDPTSRFCHTSTTLPDVGVYECFDGRFRMQSLNPDVSLWSRLPPRLANSRLAVDAHLTGGSEARYVTLGCRDQASGLAPMRYELTVAPAIQAFNLSVWQDGWKDLTEVQTTDIIHPGEELNRLELICAGTTIQAWINGQLVASVEDATYRAGFMTIGGGSFASSPVTVEVQFDNVVITEP